MSASKKRSSTKPTSVSKAAIPPSPPDSQLSEDDARRLPTAEDELARIVRLAEEEARGEGASEKRVKTKKAPKKKERKEDEEIVIAPADKAFEEKEAEEKEEKEGSDAEVEKEVAKPRSKSKKAKASAEKTEKKRKRESSAKTAPASSSKKAKKGDGALHGKKTNKTNIEVMTKVPTLKRVQDFRGFPSFRAAMDDGTITEFKKDQAVFVLPDPDSLEEPNDHPRQDEYWIALVKDIRANSTVDPVTNEWTADPSEVFVVVEWFYKVADLEAANVQKKIVDTVEACEKYFGWKEVIRSDHQAVISVFSCCEPVPIYHFQDNASSEEPAVKLIDEVHRLENDAEDDNDSADLEAHPNHLHASSQNNYFYRLSLPSGQVVKKKGRKAIEFESLNLHCLCQKPYSPAYDRMRYCLPCSKWFHEKCIAEKKWDGDEPEIESPTGAKPPSDLAELAALPIVRGGMWGIGGNINIVSKAKDIVRSGEFENYDTALTLAGGEEWKEWVKWVEAHAAKSASAEDKAALETFYQCPECSERM